MSSTDYDRIIAQERKALISIKEQGEKLIPEFKKTAASYVRELSINLMKSYLTHRPEVARNLGAKKTEAMKAEFEGILASLPAQASQRLDDSLIWLHRMTIPDRAISDMQYSYQFERKANKALDQAIRDLIGLVGSMLVKYGFIEVGKDYNWKISPGDIPHYANDLPSRGMQHHKALSSLMEQYKDLLIEYVYAFQNLRKAEKASKEG
jgi:hypothetical protein